MNKVENGVKSENDFCEVSKIKNEDEILKYERNYHLAQFDNPKQSTIKFCEFLEKNGVVDQIQNIVDIGSGMGAVLYYMSKRWKNVNLIGIDIDEELINKGRELLKYQNSEIKLTVGDLYNISNYYKEHIDLLINLQTLNWLEDYKKSLDEMTKLNPSWFAFSVLLYDGPINFDINVTEFFGENLELERPHSYKIYSLPLIQKQLKNIGYSDITIEPFEIDIDLPKPSSNLMQTYTEKLSNGKRLQISGSLIMNWYFILARKKIVIKIGD